MATALARVPSGPLAWDGADIFGDDFDDVVAAVFASDGDAPAWLDAPINPAPASKAPASTVAPRAAPARAPAPPRADGKQAVTPLHRCVNPTHAVPCAWCVFAAPPHPTHPVAGRFRPPRAPRAHAGAPPRRPGAHPRRLRRMSWTTSWWATRARCGARSPHFGSFRVARVPLPPAPGARAERQPRRASQKNGEKKLRSQLTHTPEWNNVRLRRVALRRNRSIQAGRAPRRAHTAPRRRNPALGPAPRAPCGPWRAPDAPRRAIRPPQTLRPARLPFERSLTRTAPPAPAGGRALPPGRHLRGHGASRAPRAARARRCGRALSWRRNGLRKRVCTERSR